MYKVKGADNNEYGPISADQVRQWIRENRLNRQSLVENVEAPGWKALGEFSEFAAAFPSASATPAPAYVGYTTPVVDRSAVAATLKLPGIILIIFAVLGFLLTLAGPFVKKVWVESMVHFIDQANVQLPPESRSQLEATANSGFGVQDAFGLVLGLAVNSVILAGGIKMLKVQTWGLCLAAVILIMLPCGASCLCCIGLPLGIWMAILLSKPEVKEAFRQT